MNDEGLGPTLGVHFREESTLYTAYNKSKKITEEQQGPTLSVHLREVSTL